MKTRLRVLAPHATFLGAVLLTWSVFLSHAPALGAQPAASSPAGENPAMRAIFVDAFGIQYRDHLGATRLIDQLRAYGAQHAMVQVCVLGEAYYDSKIMPRPLALALGYDDPLKDMLDLASKEKDSQIKIHAWISPLQTHNARAILAPQKGHVAVKHPDWLTEDIEGNRTDEGGWHYLDPGHPEAQDYIVSVVKEVATNYKVAGIYIDGLQYPEQGSRFGYNPTALERYRKETGAAGRPDPLDTRWLEWRRIQLTQLLTRITRAVKEIRPELVVSVGIAATGTAPKNADGFRYSQPYMGQLQEWTTWARYGLADWMFLLNFCDEQAEAFRFDNWMDFAMQNRGDSKFWIAVAGYHNWSLDAFRQVQRARLAGAFGVGIFNFRQPVRDLSSAPDFFAAVRTTTTLNETAGATKENAGIEAPTESLQARLDRMAQAVEKSQTTGPSPEAIPGLIPEVVAGGPASGPSTQAATASSKPSGAEETETASAGTEEIAVLDPWDTIFLTNHSEFQGHKLSEANGESIFETRSGIIIKISNQYIDRIVTRRKTE